MVSVFVSGGDGCVCVCVCMCVCDNGRVWKVVECGEGLYKRLLSEGCGDRRRLVV